MDTPQPRSGGLHHKAGPNAAGTRTNSFNGPVRTDMPYLLEVGIPDTLGLVICVADVISDMGCFPAELTNSAHNQCFLSVYFELESQLTWQKMIYTGKTPEWQQIRIRRPENRKRNRQDESEFESRKKTSGISQTPLRHHIFRIRDFKLLTSSAVNSLSR